MREIAKGTKLTSVMNYISGCTFILSIDTSILDIINKKIFHRNLDIVYLRSLLEAYILITILNLVKSHEQIRSSEQQKKYIQIRIFEAQLVFTRYHI